MAWLWGDGSASGGEETALHEVVPLASLGDELRHITEIVAVVGVSDDDVPPACRLDSTHHGVSVAALSHGNNPGADGVGQLCRAIFASVVCNEDFAREAGLGQRLESLRDARSHRLKLVQARITTETSIGRAGAWVNASCRSGVAEPLGSVRMGVKLYARVKHRVT